MREPSPPFRTRRLVVIAAIVTVLCLVISPIAGFPLVMLIGLIGVLASGVLIVGGLFVARSVLGLSIASLVTLIGAGRSRPQPPPGTSAPVPAKPVRTDGGPS